MAIKHLLHNAYKTAVLSTISKPDIPKLQTLDSSTLLKTLQNQRNINISNIIITWDHHVLSSFLLPPQNLPQMSPGVPKMCPGNSKTSPRRPQALSKISSRSRSTKKVIAFPPLSTHLKTMVRSPKSTSQKKSPEIMARSAGPRRVCNHENKNKNNKVGGPPKALQ